MTLEGIIEHVAAREDLGHGVANELADPFKAMGRGMGFRGGSGHRREPGARARGEKEFGRASGAGGVQIVESRAEKPGRAAKVSASSAPRSTTDRQPLPSGPWWTNVARRSASTTQSSLTP